MAKEQKETIKKISVNTRRVNGGYVWTKTTIRFESGKRYATSIQGFDRRFEKFAIGDKVLATIAGDTILQVQKT